MDQHPETVKVVDEATEHGYRIINRDDLTDEHRLFDEDIGKPAPSPRKPKGGKGYSLLAGGELP
jgi:hypothetical protein